MKATVIVLALLFSVPGISQEVEHAPTVAQCQADQRLWLSKLEADHGLDDVTYPTLIAWGVEMGQCDAVDNPNHHKYYVTNSDIIAAESLRELGFIYRHGLYQQFIAEDAAGKRE